jgi:RND family efflux transporter MFP subunit
MHPASRFASRTQTATLAPAFTLTLAVTLAAALSACSEKPATSSPQKTPPSLATITLEQARVAQEIRFDGVIEALNQATVSAQTQGRVLEIPVDVGDFVRKGDLILRMTDAEQKARAAAAQARFAEASAQYQRMQDLLAKKLIAKADADKAEAAFKSADAEQKESQQALGYTAIYAPYAGIVVSRAVKVGETVAPGTPLLTGLSLEQLRVQVDIPQAYIGPVRKFKQARIQLANNRWIDSSDLRIPPSADAQSHSFRVLINLPEGQHDLFPGTLVKVAFVAGETEQLLVPASAIAQRGEMSAVYAVTAQGLELRQVRLGSRTSDDRFPILAGLSASEKIAADPVAAAIATKAAQQGERKVEQQGGQHE